MTDAIRELGHRLIRDGYVDNEPDAFLAAIRIIDASARVSGSEKITAAGTVPTD